MRNIIPAIAALFFAASQITAQDTAKTASFAVHGEIMAETAPNITVGTKSVQAVYRDAEIVLQYSGAVYLEINGVAKDPIPARVFMLEPNVWVAEMTGGEYIKVFAVSGNANAYIDNQYRVFKRD